TLRRPADTQKDGPPQGTVLNSKLPRSGLVQRPLACRKLLQGGRYMGNPLQDNGINQLLRDPLIDGSATT
ncbi:hypothetical protein, partial [Gemmatimonas sp.]|uniref:hypothetical protein n=1 Tax=Gemmatimonas sp. TaxID=1962908 RepID=UPI0037C0C663